MKGKRKGGGAKAQNSNGGWRRRQPPLSRRRRRAFRPGVNSGKLRGTIRPEPGVPAPIPPGSVRSLRSFGVPRGLPAQGRGPGGSPLGRSGTRVPVPAPCDSESRSFGPVGGGILGRSLGSACGSPWIGILGPAGSQLPSRSPVLPDDLARPVRRWQRADFRPASAGQIRTCVPTCLSVFRTEVRNTAGRFSKPAAFASAKGQARSFRLAAASSAALPSLSDHRLVRQGPDRSGCGWEGSHSVAGRSSWPRIEAVMKNESVKGESACG